jgi:hypothetical protein
VLPLRLLFAAVFLVSLPFGLCSSSPDTTPSAGQVKALRSALAAIGDDPNELPPLAQNYDCTINVTIQANPPASPFHDVHGKCIWTVEQQGNVWIATFKETWLCDDWSATAAGYPPCEPPTGVHEWQYQVDASGAVQEIENKGPFAPDQH